MWTRSIDLTEDQSELVDRLVVSGRYRNASEVLSDGLRLLERREAEDAAKLRALQDAAQIGLSDIEAGRCTTFENADALRRHLAALGDEALAEPIG